ncbi:MAG: TolC family protein [Bacteroidota bacterium]
MIHFFKYTSLFFLLIFFNKINAQKVLTLEAAINQALENNHDIRLKKIDANIAKNNVNPAMVGKRPTVELNAAASIGWSDAAVETINLAPNAEGNTALDLNGFNQEFSIGPQVNFLLFDGKASTYRLEQLKTVSDINNLSLRHAMEQTVLEVSNLYLAIARQESQKTILKQSIALTQDRLNRSVTDEKYGTATSLQSLQIQVDLKTDSINLRNLELHIDNTRRQLNFVLGLAPDETFEVIQKFTVQPLVSLAELEANLRQENTLLEVQKKNILAADFDQKMANAAFLPTVSAFGGANFFFQQDEANFLQQNRVFGPSIGLRMNYPIFDGGARTVRASNAKLEIEKRKLDEHKLEDDLVTQLHIEYANYKNSKRDLAIEKSNLSTFEKNLEFLQDNFKNGLANNTDVRAAQLNLNALKNKITDYEFQLYLAEIKLNYLAGRLVK